MPIRFFSGSGYFQGSDADEVTQINASFNMSAFADAPHARVR
jgi:hypothetical protein